MCVNLNDLFTPSNPATRVCKNPAPSEDKFIAVPFVASDAFAANFIVFAPSEMIK